MKCQRSGGLFSSEKVVQSGKTGLIVYKSIEKC